MVASVVQPTNGRVKRVTNTKREVWFIKESDTGERAATEDYSALESFRTTFSASSTVVMNCAGKMMVEFFSVEISAIV